MTKQDYMHLPKERLAELLEERDSLEETIEERIAEKFAELFGKLPMQPYPYQPNPNQPNPFQPISVLYGCLLVNQWISVKEALPTERDKEDEQYSTNVFVRTKDCIRYAYYDFYNESWCSVEGGYRFGGDVTHWMPIPEMKGDEK